ncbi:MAG: pyruvate kinase [bacterium]
MGKRAGGHGAAQGAVMLGKESLRGRKTKIICTIGPASQDQSVMQGLIRAGMDVARLNFSHGDEKWHEEVVAQLRRASERCGTHITLLGDLPGPKIRIGRLAVEPIWLEKGGELTITTAPLLGDKHGFSVELPNLPRKLRPGNKVFLNDGIIGLEVIEIRGDEIRCVVTSGGELRSHKGLNLPGVDLGIEAFTPQDRKWLEFALKNGLHVLSQSFVQSAMDLKKVRGAARELGKEIFLLAKIERGRALENLDEILEEADGIMIARGDLGVEMPIEQVPLIQKEIIKKCNILGKPVITATQMLESMTEHPRPTRAEATDVANAILDGTDCVMLSAESAAGRYPLEAVETLERIAREVEASQSWIRQDYWEKKGPLEPRDLLAAAVGAILERTQPVAIFVPTKTGATARSIAAFRPLPWVVAVSSSHETFEALCLSRGIHPVWEPKHPEDWKNYIRKWLEQKGIPHGLVILTEGPSSLHPQANHRVEILETA